MIFKMLSLVKKVVFPDKRSKIVYSPKKLYVHLKKE